MKKSIILIMLLLTISLAGAEDFNDAIDLLYERASAEEPIDGPMVMDLADFSEEPIQAIWVSKGDQLMFNMFDQRHGLFIKDLIKDNVKVIFFPNKIEGQSSKGAGSLPLKEGRAIMIDVNNDDSNDLLVRLYEIDNEAMSAVLILQDVRKELETSVPTGSGVVPVEKDDNKANRNVFLVLALVVLGLFGFLLMKKGKQKESDYIEIRSEETNSEKDFKDFE